MSRKILNTAQKEILCREIWKSAENNIKCDAEKYEMWHRKIWNIVPNKSGFRSRLNIDFKKYELCCRKI